MFVSCGLRLLCSCVFSLMIVGLLIVLNSFRWVGLKCMFSVLSMLVV